MGAMTVCQRQATRRPKKELLGSPILVNDSQTVGSLGLSCRIMRLRFSPQPDTVLAWRGLSRPTLLQTLDGLFEILFRQVEPFADLQDAVAVAALEHRRYPMVGPNAL